MQQRRETRALLWWTLEGVREKDYKDIDKATSNYERCHKASKPESANILNSSLLKFPQLNYIYDPHSFLGGWLLFHLHLSP
jgi:hypothetical protein